MNNIFDNPILGGIHDSFYLKTETRQSFIFEVTVDVILYKISDKVSDEYFIYRKLQ